MADLTKSIKDIFEERISSPFYGSLIVSWLLWNWQIPYVTFFVDGDKLNVDKITYINANCINWWHLSLFPLISTVIIIWILPLLTNKAYEITLIYDNKRKDKRDELEGKRRLTVEQSMDLRMENQRMLDEYAEMLSKSEEEIKKLKDQLNMSLKTKSEPVSAPDSLNSKYEQEFENSKNHPFHQTIKDIGDSFRQGVRSLHFLGTEAKDYFIFNDIIYSKEGNYFFTKKGEYFYRKYLQLSVELLAKKNKNKASKN